MGNDFYEKLVKGAFIQQSVHWSPGMTLVDVEKFVVINALRHFRGNKAETAKSLGIAVNTLSAKLDSYMEDLLDEERRVDEQRRKREEFDRRARGQVPAARPFGERAPSVRKPNSAERASPFQLGGYTLNGARPPLKTYDPKAPKANVQSNDASSGVRVEPASQPATQQNMSVPKREEVQKVLQTYPSKGGQGGRR